MKLLKNTYLLTNKTTGNKIKFKFLKSDLYVPSYKIKTALIEASDKLTEGDFELVNNIWYTDDARSWIKNNDYYNYHVELIKND